jgi:hypothetical protein
MRDIKFRRVILQVTQQTFETLRRKRLSVKIQASSPNPKSSKRTIAARENGSFGGQGRASRYEPVILSEWSSWGGKAVLEKYGPAYFKQLRRRRKRYPKQSPSVTQTNPRVVAARANGQRGGLARAQLHDPEQLKQWARLGGIATRRRHGADFFRTIRKRRKRYRRGYLTRKTKARLKAQASKINERMNQEIR